MNDTEKIVKAEYKTICDRLSRNLVLRDEVEELHKMLAPNRQTKFDDADFAFYIKGFVTCRKFDGVQSILTAEGTAVEEHAAVLLRGSFERVAETRGGRYNREMTVWQYAV